MINESLGRDIIRQRTDTDGIRCCMAHIFDMNYEEVPAFDEINKAPYIFTHDLNHFIHSKGCVLCAILPNNKEGVIYQISRIAPINVYSIMLELASLNIGGHNHMVVCETYRNTNGSFSMRIQDPSSGNRYRHAQRIPKVSLRGIYIILNHS